MRFDAVVRADVGTYRWRDESGAWVEAECIDRVMVVELVRPQELEPHGLKEVLDMGGKFVGLAPQRWAAGHGRFKVTDLA